MTPSAGHRVLIVKRGRAAIVWGLAGFLGLQLGLALAMAFYFPALRDPAYGSKAARLWCRTRTDPSRPLTVVMMGSSRTEFGLRGKLLEDRLARELKHPVVVFNFGISGGGPVLELLYAKRLLAQGVRPDLLLIEVLPPLLDGKLSLPWEEHWLAPNRLRLEETRWVQNYGIPTSQFRRNWWRTWAIPWYEQRIKLLSYLAPGWLPFTVGAEWFTTMDDCGWVAQPFATMTPEARRRAEEKVRRQFAPYLAGFRLGGPACRAVRDLLDLSREKGIATALVLMPEGQPFRSRYPAGAWPQIRSYLGELHRAFGVPVIDAHTWIADDEFSDSHHLMPHGAALFSQRLERDVRRILSQGLRNEEASQAMRTASRMAPATR